MKALADVVIDTTKFNVHELRASLIERFQAGNRDKNILISCVSFGYREGVPDDADLVFDVRFLPNPHFIPKFRPHTGQHPEVAKYIRSFPQTREFIRRISELLIYLIPHYISEGKSYLTIAFGCTGGKHRSVMIAEEVQEAPGQSRIQRQGRAPRFAGGDVSGLQSYYCCISNLRSSGKQNGPWRFSAQ